jgi:putative DNA primase/helicase
MDKNAILERLNFKSNYESEVQGIRWGKGAEGVGLCPFHDDHNPSLSVNSETGLFFCHTCGAKGDIIDFHMRRYGVDFKTTLAELAERAGVTASDDRRIIAIYDYQNEAGDLLFQVVKYPPKPDGKKDFRQRRPDGHGGWIWSVKGIALVPYNLQAVMAAEAVFIAEGEKCCARALRESVLWHPPMRKGPENGSLSTTSTSRVRMS